MTLSTPGKAKERLRDLSELWVFLKRKWSGANTDTAHRLDGDFPVFLTIGEANPTSKLAIAALHF